MRIQVSGKFLLVESEILGSGFQNSAQGIKNPANDWNPQSKFHWKGIQNPESRTVVDYLGWGEMLTKNNHKSLSGELISKPFNSLPLQIFFAASYVRFLIATLIERLKNHYVKRCLRIEWLFQRDLEI